MTQQFQNFVGTIANNKLIHAQTPFLGQLLPQQKITAIRIQMRFAQGALPGRYGQRRRPQGIFIRGELADAGRIEPQLPRHLINRLARLVDRLG